MNYRLLLEYDGTGYAGWQAQKNARSIQGTLREAAERVTGGEVDLQGAGRTDAGVHALGQVAHLRCPRRLEPRRLQNDLNDLLPATINVLSVREAPEGFHARHDAKWRAYVYVISRRRSAFGKRYLWWVKDRLDTDRMAAACALFKGLHDFGAFADKRRDKNLSPLVLIHDVGLARRGDLLLLSFVASHFLWKMIRRMVGAVVEVGRGKMGSGDLEAALHGGAVDLAPLTAPPSGLFLAAVGYEGEGGWERVRFSLPVPGLGWFQGIPVNGAEG